jgi:hypothetical protein
MKKSSALADWTPEQLALGKRWVETWKLAAVGLERIKRKEIRELDTYKAISLLCGTADYTKPPYAPCKRPGLRRNLCVLCVSVVNRILRPDSPQRRRERGDYTER